jgi:hypothetical protein
MSTTIYHMHHIVPKHIGGTDDPSNLARLSIEEHAEAHRSLYEQYGRWQDYVAWKSLSGQISCAAATRMAQSIANSKPKTAEHKKKIAQSNSKPKNALGKKACQKNSKKGVAVWKGQHHSEEHKKHIGKIMSEFWSGKPKPLLRKKVYGDGVVYESIGQASEMCNISRTTVHNRIKNDKFDWRYYEH